MGKGSKTGADAGSRAEAPSPRFDAATNIADALATDPDLAGRLTALHPALQRLCEAPAGKRAGGPTTLADAAAEAGVPLADLLQAANARSPAACERRYRDAAEEERPHWMDRFDEASARRVDVRPLIREGREPFTAVMTTAGAVPAGSGLLIEAPFNPLPLRRVLEDKGFASYARRQSEQHWRIFCQREGEGEADAAPPAPGAGARRWDADDGVHIDVRGLQAPAPLTAILSLLDGPDHGGLVTVHHERDPVYLYPQLAERGWSWSRIPGEPGEIRLLLRKESA